jgi:Uma2 family endonuclease
MEAQVVAEVLGRYPDLRMGYEEFLGLGCDVHGDWIDGQVVLAGSETDVHSNVLGFLSALMLGYEQEKAGGESMMRFQMRPRPDLPSREVDLLYLAPDHVGRIQEYTVEGPADLVIEIVSDATRERDRAKVAEFERGGIREYWLIDPVREETEVYRMDGSGRYALVDPGTPPVLRSEVVPGLWFRAEWFWPETMPRLHEVRKEWGLA